MQELNDSTQFINNTIANNTFGNHGYPCHGSYPSTKVQLLAYFFVLVFSLAGNVIIIVVFYRDKTLRTTVNYFIVNMCVSDLIFPIINLPIWITLEYDEIWFKINKLFSSRLLCKTALIALNVSVLVSVFSMTALAADRFRAIIFPMKPVLFSQKKCCLAITAIWISSVPFLVHYATVRIPVTGNYASDFALCIYKGWIAKPFEYNFWMFLTLVCSSGIALTVFYLKVAIFLYRQKNSLHLASEVIKKRAKRNRKIITMLIIIVILFYVVWVPFLMVIFSYKIQACVFNWFAYCILPILNPVMNPIVYFVFNGKYRRGLMKILCCFWLYNQLNKFSRQGNRVHNVSKPRKVFDNVEIHEQ